MPSTATASRASNVSPGAPTRRGEEHDTTAYDADSAARTDADVPRVRGSVVLDDGEVVDSGSMSVYCRQGDAYVLTARAGLGEDGSFEAPGCEFASCWALSSAIASGGPWHWDRDPTSPVEVHAAAGATLQLQIEDENGAPILGADVFVFAKSGEHTATSSDDTGMSSLRLPIVFHQGERGEVACPPRERIVAAAQQLGSPAASSARALDDASDIESSTGIEAFDPDQEHDSRRAADAPSAEAPSADAPTLDLLEQASDAAYVLEVRATGYAPVRRVFEVDSAPTRVVMTQELRDQTIRGSVRGSDGELFARAWVLARGVDDRGEQVTEVVDAAGRFELTTLRGASYDVTIIQDGIVLDRRRARSGAQLEIETTQRARGCSVELVFLGRSGMPAVPSVLRGGPFSPSSATRSPWPTSRDGASDSNAVDNAGESVARVEPDPGIRSQLAHGVLAGRYHVRAYFEDVGWLDRRVQVDSKACNSQHGSTQLVTILLP